MKKVFWMVFLLVMAMAFSGCVNYHSPMIYDASSGGKKTVKNDEPVYILFGAKARVDLLAEYFDSRAIETMSKYTVDEERDAGSDVGVWVFRIKSGDKCFVPLSDDVLKTGKICKAQIEKIKKFVEKTEVVE